MIRTDSRKILPGDTYVALPGISSDGHDYIESAILNGASKIVATHGSYSVETQIVEDTRKYLNDALKREYGSIINNMTIIGITGTNGKTTSAYIVYQVLNKLNIPCAYIGTIGYYLDKKIKNLPNTCVDIADLYELLLDANSKGYKHVVLEASSQGIAMQRLETIKFDIAMFTNLTQDHLDYHKTMENYALAKQQLFKQLKENGKAIINADDKYKETFMLETSNNMTYGLNDGDYKITSYKMDAIKSIFNYAFNNKEYSVESSFVGKYNLYNLLGSIAILHELGIDLEDINKIIPVLELPSGRMEKIRYKDNTIIIDYAHTPDAIDNILNTIKQIAQKNIYVVFGCTGSRDVSKRPIMTNIVLKNSAKAIITIDDPHDEDPRKIVMDMLEGNNLNNYEVELDRAKAIHKGIDLLDHDDILLILGKGHEEAIIIGNKKIPFNDKQEVLKYIEEIKIENI